ncbi:MAG: hypothetical protein MJZ30_11125 [Paludibacteraceae bacterium]|nr:hypothetical protein [Paludibacteraceae bacterium]
MEAIVNGKKFEIEGDMILIRPEAGDLLFVCEGKVYEWNVCMKLHEDVVVTDEDVVSERFDGWEEFVDDYNPFEICKGNIHYIFQESWYIHQTIRRYGGVY